MVAASLQATLAGMKPTREAPTSSTVRGLTVAAAAATAVAAVGVFAAVAASAAGAAARLAVSAVQRRSALPVAGAPGPAFAGVCLAPLAAVQSVYPAAAHTSYPASVCQYWERSVQIVGDHEDGPPHSIGRSCLQKVADLRHDWLASTALLPLWREPRHGR